MYFSAFSSSKYSNKNIDICLICWLPEDKHNKIYQITDFSHITTKCKCKPKIHRLCIDEWLNKSPTCPICRTNMNFNSFSINNINRKKYLFIIECISYTSCLLQIIYCGFILQICYIFLYDSYFTYCIANQDSCLM